MKFTMALVYNEHISARITVLCNVICTLCQARKRLPTLAFETSPEVQNSGISDPTKTMSQKLKKKNSWS